MGVSYSSGSPEFPNLGHKNLLSSPFSSNTFVAEDLDQACQINPNKETLESGNQQKEAQRDL